MQRFSGDQVTVAHVGSLVGSSATEVALLEAPVRLRVNKVSLLNGDAIAAHADNYGTGTVYNKGTTGSGTTSVAAKTTKTETGAAVVAFAGWDLVMSTTPANLVLEVGESLAFKWSEAGTGQDLTLANVQIEWVPHSGMAV